MEPAPSPPLLRFGPYLVDLRVGEVRKNGRRIRLQEKSLRVLTALVRRQGQLVAREDLRKHLWPDSTFVDFETGLNTAVSKLRDVLSDSAEKPRYIETIPRRGYRFIAAVTFSDSQSLERDGKSHLTEQVRSYRTIAVLPFHNLSGNAQHDYLADGMTDALIRALSKTGHLRVTSRTSVMQYQGSRKQLPEIARELGVDFIVEGSVFQAGTRARIAAQLIDAGRDQHLWADSHEDDAGEVLALLELRAEAIALAPAKRIGEPGSATAHIARRIAPEACEAYLKGRHAFYSFTETGFKESLAWFGKAIEADPDFALAHSALAHAYAVGVAPIDVLPPRQLFEQAEAHARKALSLDESNAEARWVLGLTELMFNWNWAAGEKHVRVALASDPNNATAWIVLSVYHLLTGDSVLAVKECEYACLLDPFSTFTQSCLPYALYFARQFEKLRERMEADRPRLEGSFKYHMTWALYHIHEKNWESAIEEARMAIEKSGGCPFAKARLGYALASIGRTQEARSLQQDLIRLSESRYVSALDLAIIPMGLGEFDEALDWLDKACDERSTHLIYLGGEALFDPLRPLPRFRELLRRMNLRASPALESAT